MLTIDKQEKLQKELQHHQLKNQEEAYLIKRRLEEKDEQIKALIEKQEQFEQVIQSFIDTGQLKPKSR